MICFGDGAPVTVAFVESNDVVKVMRCGSQIKQKRLFSLKPECERSEHRAFDAMRAPSSENAAWRAAGIAIGFKIVGEGV